MAGFVRKLATQKKSLHPVHFAAWVHKQFVFIHPFVDGKRRVGRLLMNLALLREGYLLAIIPPILRAKYFHLLELAHKEDQMFTQFIGE